MEREIDNLQTKIIIFLSVAVIILALLFVSRGESEVDFSRRLLRGLVQGRISMQNLIDWEKFNGFGLDVGATYSLLPDEKERSDYRSRFILACAEGFRKAQGKLGAYTNWRIYDRGENKTIVAADCTVYNNTLLFTIYKNGKRKLASIKWEKTNAAQ